MMNGSRSILVPSLAMNSNVLPSLQFTKGQMWKLPTAPARSVFVSPSASLPRVGASGLSLSVITSL